jgi:hypothetical protein
LVIGYSDFPFWLRFAHFINIIFITLLIRSGIEILSALPKLYWNDNAKLGTEWLKFTKKRFQRIGYGFHLRRKSHSHLGSLYLDIRI